MSLCDFVCQRAGELTSGQYTHTGVLTDLVKSACRDEFAEFQEEGLSSVVLPEPEGANAPSRNSVDGFLKPLDLLLYSG